MVYIAGAYTATYKGLSLGVVDDGFELDYGAEIENVTGDNFRSRQDGVFQGIEGAIRCILNEPSKAGVLGLIWPYDATLGKTGVIGRLMSSMAGPLVLTACAGTSASPSSITVARAVIWTDRVITKFASSQRKVPVVIAALPVASSGGDTSGIIGCVGADLFTFA